MTAGDRRFLPQVLPIDAYGEGGFRFGEMSHRGSLLCLPSGMHAWPVESASELSAASFERVYEEADRIDILLIGTGAEIVYFPESLRWRFRDLRIAVDVMPTGAATRTWNVLIAEGRRVAAALVATS